MKVRHIRSELLTMHYSWTSMQSAGAASRKQWEGSGNVMALDFSLISLRLEDLGREDSSV